jgi:SRSO17 transposase
MLAETRDPQGVIAIDDTAFPKKGTHSVAVARQYCGATGKVDNCQVGVSLTYVGQNVAWPYSMELFVPASWDRPEEADCRKRRQKTRMPEETRHEPKWRMALRQLDQARTDGLPHRTVVADSWYGTLPEFRQGLADRQESYVVGVYANSEVFLEPPTLTRPPDPIAVAHLGHSIAEEDWEHLELRTGSQGEPLTVEAVSLRVWPAAGHRQGTVNDPVYLVIERRQHERNGHELRYFFSNLPAGQPTIELVRILHERFWIEQGYQQLKEELGIDHHEGRSWTGWHRHVLLVFLAYGYLTHLRLLEKKRQIQQAGRQWLKERTSVAPELLWSGGVRSWRNG